MRITLAPTLEDMYSRIVVITTPTDDLVFDDLMDIIRGAVIAYGYHPQTVADYFNDEVQHGDE